MSKRYPSRRVGKDYEEMTEELRKSHPLFSKIPKTQIDNIIAKEFYANYKNKKRFWDV